MLTKNVNSPRLWLLLSGLLGVVILGVMLATFLDYGMTADEPVQNRYGRRLVRWYLTAGEDRSATEQHDTFYYGGLFELTVQAARVVAPLGVYETRHLVNVLFGFVGIAAAWWMGAHLGGPAAGLLSALLLALTPSYYGHAFNNPKDIPFAGLYALATACALWASARAARLGGRELLVVGLAIGLTASVRVAGLVLVAYAAILWLGTWWLARDRAAGAPAHGIWADLARIALVLAGVLAVAWVVMVVFWPWAQRDPLRNPLRAFGVFSRFWMKMPVFFDGQIMASGKLPLDYIPRWFALTLPEPYFVVSLMGILLLRPLRRRLSQDPAIGRKLLSAAWLAATALVPLIWAIANRTPFYNGHRHFLFILPALAALAGPCAAAWFRNAGRPAVRLGGGVLLGAALALTATDMVRLHPYQSVYFNRLVAGGLASAARRYETDYWCSTYKEGIDWIVEHYRRAEGKPPIRVAGHATLIQVSYDLGRTEERRRGFRPVTIHDEPHLILATTAHGDHRRTPGRIVHVVERLGTPLLYVFEARPP